MTKPKIEDQGNLLGVVSRESLGGLVVGVVVRRQDRVPARPFLRVVLDDAFGEVEAWDTVAVVAGFGVDCVGAVCAVDDGLWLLLSGRWFKWLIV